MPHNNEESPPPRGCLGILLALFGINQPSVDQIPANETLPYRLTQRFLSPAELSFYKVATSLLPVDCVMTAKPRIADVLFVPRGVKGIWAFQNKIQSKHVDFLICDSQTMAPRLVIELDDKSHDRSDRRERDNFVDEAFRVAGIEVLHVRAQSSYVPSEISNMLEVKLRQTVPSQPESANSDSPQCPNCGAQLVERIAGKGRNKGSTFWGCPNYPKCHYIQ